MNILCGASTTLHFLVYNDICRGDLVEFWVAVLLFDRLELRAAARDLE